MRSVSAYAIAVAVLVALALVPRQPPWPTPRPGPTAGRRSHHHHQRVKHDRVRLRKADCLRGFARKQAARMATREEAFHQDLQPILKKCGMRLGGRERRRRLPPRAGPW